MANMRQIALQKAMFYQAKGRVPERETRPFAFMPVMYGNLILNPTLPTMHHTIQRSINKQYQYTVRQISTMPLQKKTQMRDHIPQPCLNSTKHSKNNVHQST
jgi:hypothetical protein